MQAQHGVDGKGEHRAPVRKVARHGAADGLHDVLPDAGWHQNHHQLFFWLKRKAKQLLNRFAARLARFSHGAAFCACAAGSRHHDIHAVGIRNGHDQFMLVLL